MENLTFEEWLEVNYKRPMVKTMYISKDGKEEVERNALFDKYKESLKAPKPNKYDELLEQVKSMNEAMNNFSFDMLNLKKEGLDSDHLRGCLYAYNVARDQFYNRFNRFLDGK